MNSNLNHKVDVQPRQRSELKSFVFFFLVSFIFTFLVVYVFIRGFQNPFKKPTKVGESSAVSDSSLSDAASEKTVAKNLTQQLDTLVSEQLLDKENEIIKLKEEIEFLKEANQSAQRQLGTAISPDSLLNLKLALEEAEKTIQQKEYQIKNLKTEKERIQTLRDKSFFVSTDSLNSLFASLEREKREKEKRDEELKALQRQLENLQQASATTGDENPNIKQLAKVYDAMQPEKAAQIILELDDQLIASLLKRLKQRQAAKIMGAIPPMRAAKISQMLGEL